MPTALPIVDCCRSLAAPSLTDHDAAQLERVFKAIADRHRLKILNLLLRAGDEQVCVCELQDLLALPQSNVSYHLRQLVDAGILVREKRGTNAYYGLAPGVLDQVRALLA